MQVFMSKNETLDMLEKISSRGNSAKAQLDSKNSILENLYSKLLYSHFFFFLNAPNYFRFLTIPYWECAERFSYVGITDGM